MSARKRATDKEQPANEFVVTKLWEDEEIGGRIYCQMMALFAGNLLQDEKNRFFQHTDSVMHKLSALKYHLSNYTQLEKRQLKIAKKQFKNNAVETREAFELIFELEAFLFQCKSCLDMAVKLLIPAIGRGLVRTASYSKAGDDLIKGLEQYKKKKDVRVDAVDALVALVKDSKQAWIETTVTVRDRLNHTEALKGHKFLPMRLPNDQIAVRKPKFLGWDTVELLKLIYENSLLFHQEFMARTLALKAPPYFHLGPQDEAEAVRDFGVRGRFIKYCWYHS